MQNDYKMTYTSCAGFSCTVDAVKENVLRISRAARQRRTRCCMTQWQQNQLWQHTTSYITPHIMHNTNISHRKR